MTCDVRTGMRVAVIVGVLVLASGCGTGDVSPARPAPDGPGTPSAGPASEEGASPSGSEAAGELRYVGPSVSFDVPVGWHEFDLVLDGVPVSDEAPLGYFAAYGPVFGGHDDYVSVAPLPATFGSGSTVEILDELVPPEQRSGQQVRQVDVNGLEGHQLELGNGELHGVITLVVGERGRYLIACQTGDHVADAIMRGCETAAGSLVETPPPTFEEPSGCTRRELEMIDEIAVPPGAEPTMLTARMPDGVHSCDFEAIFPEGGDGRVPAMMEEALDDAGWTIERSGVDRQLERFDVYQLIGMRDFDILLVEIYIDDDFTQNYFVTSFDR